MPHYPNANANPAKHQTKPIVLSGIQPSGHFMIGNYIGAIQHWIALQATHRCFFMLVDLHAITVPQDPLQLRERSYDLLALYLAAGLDPEQHSLFVQSHVPAHAELGWILNCFTTMGELSRMTQFKDKSERFSGNIPAGLFNYPVLMAADILLYNANLVPVGSDQKQHLELTRNIALRFNKRYGDVFTIPEPYIPPQGARIMSLQAPEKKMSKSDENINNYIGLLDSPNVIIKKLKQAVTDSGSDVHYSDDKPGIANLLTLFSAVTGQSIGDLEIQYATAGYGTFKSNLADAVVAFLTPLQAEYKKRLADKAELHRILAKGAEHAREQAAPCLKRVKDVIGLILPT